MGGNYLDVLGVKNKTIDLTRVNKSVYFKRIIFINIGNPGIIKPFLMSCLHK